MSLNSQETSERILSYSRKNKGIEVLSLSSKYCDTFLYLKELGWNCINLSIQQDLQKSNTIELYARDFLPLKLIYISSRQLQSWSIIDKLIDQVAHKDTLVCLDTTLKISPLLYPKIVELIKKQTDLIVLNKNPTLNRMLQGVVPWETTVIFYDNKNQGWIQKGHSRYKLNTRNQAMFTSGILHGYMREKNLNSSMTFANILNHSFEEKVDYMSKSAWEKAKNLLKGTEN